MPSGSLLNVRFSFKTYISYHFDIRGPGISIDFTILDNRFIYKRHELNILFSVLQISLMQFHFPTQFDGGLQSGGLFATIAIT